MASQSPRMVQGLRQARDKENGDDRKDHVRTEKATQEARGGSDRWPGHSERRHPARRHTRRGVPKATRGAHPRAGLCLLFLALG